MPINGKLAGRRTILLRLSGFPCRTIGVWTGTNSSTSVSFPTYGNPIIPFLIFFVKNSLVPDQATPFLFINLHKRNNRIFKIGVICRHIQTKNCLKSLFI